MQPIPEAVSPYELLLRIISLDTDTCKISLLINSLFLSMSLNVFRRLWVVYLSIIVYFVNILFADVFGVFMGMSPICETSFYPDHILCIES